MPSQKHCTKILQDMVPTLQKISYFETIVFVEPSLALKYTAKKKV